MIKASKMKLRWINRINNKPMYKHRNKSNFKWTVHWLSQTHLLFLRLNLIFWNRFLKMKNSNNIKTKWTIFMKTQLFMIKQDFLTQKHNLPSCLVVQYEIFTNHQMLFTQKMIKKDPNKKDKKSTKIILLLSIK